jgi:hypothetical protein
MAKKKMTTKRTAARKKSATRKTATERHPLRDMAQAAIGAVQRVLGRAPRAKPRKKPPA